MYKILISYNLDHNLWHQYGTTTTSSSDNKSTFTEFTTDDIKVLKAELLKLDKIHGFQKLRVIQDIEVNYNVDVIIDDESSENKDDNIEIDADKESDLEI